MPRPLRPRIKKPSQLASSSKKPIKKKNTNRVKGNVDSLSIAEDTLAEPQASSTPTKQHADSKLVLLPSPVLSPILKPISTSQKRARVYDEHSNQSFGFSALKQTRHSSKINRNRFPRSPLKPSSKLLSENEEEQGDHSLLSSNIHSPPNRIESSPHPVPRDKSVGKIKDDKQLKTADLETLLPRRKRRKRIQQFNSSDLDDDSENEDILTRTKRRVKRVKNKENIVPHTEESDESTSSSARRQKLEIKRTFEQVDEWKLDVEAVSTTPDV
ncbi:hypothetical protein NEOLI_004100 [Neolecta irregularis DAH-3]|uniref:Uncharacterized protein n=1 Tax=Neolecta irregularis (strain DAH-3) TaxID=1198029 RepID=A0A1U7LQX1_NEOID|nr:hypothetical protein NEOLI_004100 [Neolecta irregularis DAH-3]|eukprot:OLL25070.1 hypothetical protein NEOLI_004100 [Neolecta irregularis DAH-3]